MTIDTKLVNPSSPNDSSRRRNSNPFDSAETATERSSLLPSSSESNPFTNEVSQSYQSSDMGHDIAPPSYQAITQQGFDEERGPIALDECPYADGPEARAWKKRRRRAIRRSKARKCCARFMKMLLCTSIALLVGLFIGNLIWERDSTSGHPYGPAPKPPTEDGSVDKRPDWTTPHKVPANNRPIYNGDDRVDVWFTETSFELDVDAAQLWFHAYGRHVGGEVLINRPAELPGNKVAVSVKAVYSDKRLFDSITVAKVADRGKGAQGVGIYESDGSGSRNKYDEVYFTVSYAFPGASSGQQPSEVSSLETVVDNMSITTDNLGGNSGLIFGDWTAKSENGHITLESLIATKLAKITTENGAVTSYNVKAPLFDAHSENGHVTVGRLDVSDSIKLVCNNGRIDALEVETPVATVQSHNGRIGGTFNVSRSLELESNTGAINAKVRVQAPHKEVEDQGVTVRASTEAGRVELVYLEHPEGIKLVSTAKSSVGQIYVEHPETYQGQFSATTNVGTLSLDGPGTTKGREWHTDHFDGRWGKKRVDGRTWWKRNARKPGEGEDGGNEDNVKGWGSTTATASAGKVHFRFN